MFLVMKVTWTMDAMSLEKKKSRCEEGMSEEERSRKFVKLTQIKQIHQIQSIVMQLEINE